ncbi:MAG: glutathione-dependent formaldehyde dehydrogenase [Streptosporangiaceae bacterium]|nr:glutathione-dependent formaldehyde dehydrogenase [Streptosporangiaceae bacterium]
MKATCWIRPNTVKVTDVPDPAILNRRDAIIKVTSTAICGSDLHLLDGYVPTMQKGDILGHEFMGEVVETGAGVDRDRLRVGDRVVVPFPIACGACAACRAELYSCCENTNPNAGLAEKFFGHPTAGIFGYSHLTGGFAGGQAQYARVPFADVGPLKVDADLSDEQVLFLSDILPTGYMGAEMCDIARGDVVAVWGAGPVGQLAMDSARLLGAEKVIGIDKEPYRLAMAEQAGHTTIDFTATDVRSELLELTGGRGPDKCIEAVGMEAVHGTAPIHAYDKAKQAARSESERPHALRQAITSCRSGGIVSVVGVYGGFVDKFPSGSWMNRSITLRTGQAHVHRYMRPLLEHIKRGTLDPARVITHTLPLAKAPHGYDIFKHKKDGCEKVVLKPWLPGAEPAVRRRGADGFGDDVAVRLAFGPRAAYHRRHEPTVGRSR